MGINGENDDDGVNKAKRGRKKPILGQHDFGVKAVNNIGRAFNVKTAQERYQEERMGVADADLTYADTLERNASVLPIEEGDDPDHWTKYAKNLRRKAGVTAASAEQHLHTMNQSKTERFNQQSINAVSRSYSSKAINSTVNDMTSTPEVQLEAMSLSKKPWKMLARAEKQISGKLNEMGEENSQVASVFIGSEGPTSDVAAKFAKDRERGNQLVGQLAVVRSAKEQAKMFGNDPDSKQKDLFKMAEKARGIVSLNKIQDDIRGGKSELGNMSAKDFRTKEVEAAQKLSDAFEKLHNTVGKTDKEIEALSVSAEQAKKELKDIEDIKRAGGGGKGSGNTDSIQHWSSGISNLFSIAANTFQAMAVTQPMKQMSNIAGLANIENQKYDTYMAAVSGDQHARLKMGGWSTADAMGTRMGSNMQIATGAQVIASAATAVGGGAQAVGSYLTADTNGMIQGAGNVAGGVSSGLIYGNDFAKNLSKTEARIAGVNMTNAATSELTYVPGKQAQQWHNYSRGMLDTAQEMGGEKGSEFYSQIGKQNYYDKMKAAGLSPEQNVAFSQSGVQNTGSMFDANMPIRAKELETQAKGSAEQQMNRYGVFAGAGGQNPMQSLDKMVAAGTAAGLSGSKVLTVIADNTGQLAAVANSRGGVDVLDQISQALINSTDANNPNKEFAVAQAAKTYASEEEYRNNSSVSVMGMMNIGRMDTALGLKDFAVSAKNAVDLPEAKLRAMLKMSKDDAREEMNYQGINVRNNKLFNEGETGYKDVIQQMLNMKVQFGVEKGGTGVATDMNQLWPKALAYINEDPELVNQRWDAYLSKDGKDLKPEIREIHDRDIGVLRTAGTRDPIAVFKQRRMSLQPEWVDDKKTDDKTSPTMDMAAYIKNASGRVQTDAVSFGQSAVGGTSGEAATTSKLVNDTALSQEKWASAAADAAKDFGLSTTKIDIAADKMLQAAQLMLDKSGASKISTSVQMPPTEEQKISVGTYVPIPD